MLVLYACLFAVSGIAGSSAVSPLPAPLEYLTPADILRMFIGYCATAVRFDISHAVSVLSRQGLITSLNVHQLP